MSKKNNKNKFNQNHKSSNQSTASLNKNSEIPETPTNGNSNSLKTISLEEFKEYEILKGLELAKKFNLDISEYRKNREKQIDEEINLEKEIKLKEFESELQGRKAAKEKELNQELISLREEVSNAKSEKGALEKENIAEKIKWGKTIEDAKEKANVIIANAEKEAAKAHEAYQKKIVAMEKDLENRGQEILLKETELSAKEKVLKTKEAVLETKEKIYLEANPEKVSTLENEINLKQAYIEELRANYLALRKNISENEALQLKLDGRSAESLVKENEQLLSQISSLEDKCNRFSEFELSDMKRALDEEPLLKKEIEERVREVQEKTGEINRLKNNTLELEQARAQLDLIRSLNDHLRQELETSKRALESRVGEVCPALTEVDAEEKDDKGPSKESYERRQQLNSERRQLTLCQIVQHVKRYAASQQVPLFYEEKDIRAFLAGLAASKLAIIQGLSGTGKTSLPKVFADALTSEKKVVPVESSWRDRNELLGYYNDFNRKFTAKEFTCHLYRAGMPNYAETIFFIILDEMNLSRVEYYFADFLSVLEAAEREIKLVDVDLRSLPLELPSEVVEFIKRDGNARIKELMKRIYDKKNLESQRDIIDQQEKAEFIRFLSGNFSENYQQNSLLSGPQRLLNGNTIKIPDNVWFIGTANRDESTFEITDKVYDRAQVLNFDRRAMGQKENYNGVLYVPHTVLNKLFNEAISSNPFNSLTDPLVDKIDRFLRDKFKISFGNRISMQMDKFVPVYVSAGIDPNNRINKDDLRREAIDYQLTNKVLRKLEYKQISKENLDELKKVFEDELLLKGAEFIEWKKRNEL